MQFDSLVFDLDGTLWDCCQSCAQAFNEAYQQFGIPKIVSEDFVRSICGLTSSECDEIILEGAPFSLRDELLRTVWQLEIKYVAKCATRSLFPAVREGIETLGKHYSLYVVSNCSEEYMNVFLEHTPIGRLFRDVESHGRTGESKGENIQLLVQRNNLQAPCYIGDTKSDEIGARTADIPFFHAAYGFGQVSHSQAAFQDFVDLTEYFLE